MMDPVQFFFLTAVKYSRLSGCVNVNDSVFTFAINNMYVLFFIYGLWP